MFEIAVFHSMNLKSIQYIVEVNLFVAHCLGCRKILFQ